MSEQMIDPSTEETLDEENLPKKKRKNRKQKRSREYTFITYLFFAIFGAMMLYFVYFLGFSSSSFINSPYNALSDLYSEHVVRGEIQASDGTVLAQTNVAADGTESRVYPYGREYAHVVGYLSNGKSGLENQANYNLLCSHDFILDRIKNDFSGNKNIGDNVVTTLDTECQYVAYTALQNSGFEGAVIVMKPSTGQILAMVSLPDYDPNSVAQNWDTITADGSTVLYNRATQGQYAPGSTFKIFTALEYYRENSSTYQNYSYDCSGSFTYEETTIHCAGNKAHGTESLENSFAYSCNSSFSNLSLTLNPDKFSDTLDSMLFNTKLPISFESNQSRVNISSKSSAAEIMSIAIGQGTTTVSPLHLVLIASAIDNGGVVMTPYIIDHTVSANGVTVKTYQPKKYKTIMTQEEAAFLESNLSAVTSYGTASSLSGQSYQAYGKTGTAEVSDSSDQANGWFVGYASKEGYDDIAVAVIVEDSGSSSYAVPIAKKIFDAYFN